MVQKIEVAHKHGGLRAEIKPLAYGEIGILLKLDIREGREANQKMERKDYT